MEGTPEVAVVGQPDETWGEVPVAFIVPSDCVEPVTAEQIMAHCRRSLARYKQLRAVRFVASLPKTSSGKVRRFALLGAFDGAV